MIKKRKSIISIIISIVVVMTSVVGLTGLVGCSNNIVDKTKTQLYISNYDGGVGTEWLDNVIERFSTEYAEYEFQPGTGKKGAQIFVNKNKLLGNELYPTLASSFNNIFFGERMNYYTWAREGLLMDISDVVTDKNSQGLSIESRLSDDTQKMLKVHEGKYYGLPHYEGFTGLTYDVDVFEEYLLYFNADGNFVNSLSETKSYGPDGMTGIDAETGADYSLDDGLPATYKQFERLCNTMAARGVVPFIWPGQYNEYFGMFLETFYTAYLGKEQTEVIYHFNGKNENTVSQVISRFNNDGTPVIDEEVIREDTAYLLWEQPALYYPLTMAYKLLNPEANTWYHRNAHEPTFSHLNSQESFIYGLLDNKPIGMLIDGNYWENESKDTLRRSFESSTNPKAKNRRFAWMPVPGAYIEGNSGQTKLTLRDKLSSYAFINGNITDPNIAAMAKMFLQFCYSGDELVNFTVNTGMTRPLKYDLDEKVDDLTYFARTMWNYRKSADVVNTATTSRLFLSNETTFINRFWQTTAKGVTYERPYTALYSGRLTAREYFAGMKRTSAEWLAGYRSFFEYVD